MTIPATHKTNNVTIQALTFKIKDSTKTSLPLDSRSCVKEMPLYAVLFAVSLRKAFAKLYWYAPWSDDPTVLLSKMFAGVGDRRINFPTD